ncbi:MAG TPA: hypothetical protein VFQ11_11325 [Nocardioidaceae bacterium]|jgi:hypothetical protein|nr:hypothetical protein [Nocardioidaceae bacterium]
MTAVALRPHRQREPLEWLAPAPLWTSPPFPTQPWIAELRTDDFVHEFLGVLAGAGGGLTSLAPQHTVDGAAVTTYRLFSALRHRYNLVSATLACRRLGLPDHTLRSDRDEKVSFVIHGAGDDVAGVVDGEQEYPVHRAPTAPGADFIPRTLWFGYLPTPAVTDSSTVSGPYVARLVLRYDPGCTVVSAPSPWFVFAAPRDDPDTPSNDLVNGVL